MRETRVDPMVEEVRNSDRGLRPMALIWNERVSRVS